MKKFFGILSLLIIIILIMILSSVPKSSSGYTDPDDNSPEAIARREMKEERKEIWKEHQELEQNAQEYLKRAKVEEEKARLSTDPYERDQYERNAEMNKIAFRGTVQLLIENEKK